MNRFLSRAASTALLAAAGSGLAQPAAAQLQYRSAFEGYRPFAETEVKEWRASNDTVRVIGGWRTYAREAGAAREQEPAGHATVPAPAATPPGTTPAAAPQVERRP